MVKRVVITLLAVISRSGQTRTIKIGGRLVRHARRLMFQLAEVAPPKEVFNEAADPSDRIAT